PELDKIKIFGSEKGADGKTKHDNSQTGQYKFFDAMLLCIPVRSDKRPYIHITCPDIVLYLHDCLPASHSLRSDLQKLSEIFNIETAKAICFQKELESAVIEDYDIIAGYDESKSSLLTSNLKTLFHHDI